jgi:hypothetical protein
MYERFKHASTATAVVIISIASQNAGAAEDFQVRYNIAGSIGGEMFAPPEQSGLFAATAVTRADIRKVTGNDGNLLRLSVPGGTVPLPSPVPPALYPTYAANQAVVDARGPLTQVNLGIGYITHETFGGGRILYGVNIPYANKRQNISGSVNTPALNWSPAIPAATRAAVQSQFSAQYQNTLAGTAESMSGEVAGLGDVELQAGWLYVADKIRVLAGASLVLPTGKYDPTAGPDIGSGNFYTFRPGIQIAYLPQPDIALAGKVTVGINSTNRDNRLRSGNWLGLEAAVGYKTPIGPVGVHVVHVQQYQDDSNNTQWGASRLRTSNAGLFLTTKIPVVDAAITFQYMRTIESRNSKAGNIFQVRAIKMF